jgi:hypothetical protein
MGISTVVVQAPGSWGDADMRTCWLRWGVVLVLAGLTGCRSQVADSGGPPQDVATRLGETIDISLADWLKLPRAELAKLADETGITLQHQQAAGRTNAEDVNLLPQLHAPVRVPVFEQCTFRTTSGISLPAYVNEGAKDVAVALHLARHGDRAAAMKLIDPADKDVVSQIDAWTTEKNYPLEWTRLVSLTLQSAQFKMAHGEVEGATELVQIHRQLREVLDARAARGPLGAALLPVGRRALQMAAAAWREKTNKPALAGDIEAALKEWGEVPPPVCGLAIHARKAEVAALFGKELTGRGVSATSPVPVQRALDLLALPLTPEGAEAVVAVLDPRDRLDEVLLVYRPKTNEHYPEPSDLALQLLDQGFPGRDAKSSAAIHSQQYEGGGLVYDIQVLIRGDAGGALVAVAPPAAKDSSEAAGRFGRNPRDFGAVHLDRSYQTNRAAVNPFADNAAIKLNTKPMLQKLTHPFGEVAPSAAEVVRERNHDLVASVTLEWPSEISHDSLHHLAPALWCAFGRCRFDAVEDSGGGFQLTWEGDNTRAQLQLPFDEKSPRFVVQDTRGAKDLDVRAEAARKRDFEERNDRIAAGKPQQRVPRGLQVNPPTTGGLQVDGLQLGMTRDHVLALLPGSQTLRKGPIKDGVSLLFLADPPATAPYWARQMFLRFEGNRLAEIRIRYQEGPAKPVGKVLGLLDTLRKQGGMPEELTPSWAGLWRDLAGLRKPALYRWRDDITVLTLQRDEGATEVILRDCPPEHAAGVELPPLQFCDRGIELCALGDSREQVLARHHLPNPPTAQNGAEVFSEPATSPYDILLVWYEKGKVSKIWARHRRKGSLPAAEVFGAIQAAWARNVEHLGFVRRSEAPRAPLLGAYAWHDDVTRVRIFATDSDQGTQLFTEFCGWPIPETTVATKAK